MPNRTEQWILTSNEPNLHSTPCFITGPNSEICSGPSLRPSLTGRVKSRRAGEHLIDMFGGEKYASLNWDPSDPREADVSVTIGVDPSFESHLTRIAAFVRSNDNNITVGMIDQIRAHAIPPVPKKVFPTSSPITASP